jgi:hypothetical protein
VEAFVADESPAAREKVVDRLLASPQYGERWARHWLDLARYSDGQLAADKDTPLPNAWRYRDWVVQAFNNDLPYFTFVKAQLAADLIPELKEHIAGLGFQAIGSGANDQLDVTTKAFLGLTVRLRTMPRPQVRPGTDERLLFPARDFSEHSVRRASARARTAGRKVQVAKEEDRRTKGDPDGLPCGADKAAYRSSCPRHCAISRGRVEERE